MLGSSKWGSVLCTSSDENDFFYKALQCLTSAHGGRARVQLSLSSAYDTLYIIGLLGSFIRVIKVIRLRVNLQEKYTGSALASLVRDY
jgi:hypothetical protein